MLGPECCPRVRITYRLFICVLCEEKCQRHNPFVFIKVAVTQLAK